MDKENGENTEGGSNSSKLSNPPDPSALLDAASLFGEYFYCFLFSKLNLLIIIIIIF